MRGSEEPTPWTCGGHVGADVYMFNEPIFTVNSLFFPSPVFQKLRPFI